MASDAIQFPIFEKSSNIEVTPTVIYLTTQILGLIVAVIINCFGLQESSISSHISCICILGPFGYFIYRKFKRLTEQERMSGTVNGYVTLQEKNIQVKHNMYQLDDIIEIDFTINDYVDKVKCTSAYNLNGIFSNGTKNQLIIRPKYGHRMVINFQLQTNTEFIKAFPVCLYYFNKNLISKHQLISCFNTLPKKEFRQVMEQITALT